MNSWLSRRVLLPLIYRMKGMTALRVLAALERSQWLTPEQVRDQQWTALKRVLRHAYEHVPHYRASFEELGVTPEDVRTPEDLLKVPTLSKDDLNTDRDGLVAEGIDPASLRAGATGGSTGEPTRFLHSRPFLYAAQAATLRSYRWCGQDVAGRAAYLWGSALDLSREASWKGRISSAVSNQLWLPAFRLTRANMLEYADAIARFRPVTLTGYCSALRAFAEFLLEEGIGTVSPKAVISSAETLFPEDREKMETAFGCSVLDRYGGRELGDIAHECLEGRSLHVNAENVYVECVDAERRAHVPPGEPGEIVLTSLTEFAAPFIRYRVGDLGRLSNDVCSCGRGLPLLESVEGRVHDLLHRPGGGYLPGEFFPHLFKECPGVRQFQVIQSAVTQLKINIVPGSKFSDRDLDIARAHIRGELGAEMEVQFHVAEEIEPTPSGKHRFTICEIPDQVGGVGR